MNTFQRRQIVKGQIIDLSVAKAAFHKSQRQQAEAAKGLRKAMVAARFMANTDTISYPSRASE